MKISLPKRPRRCVMSAFIGGAPILAIASAHLFVWTLQEAERRRRFAVCRWTSAKLKQIEAQSHPYDHDGPCERCGDEPGEAQAGDGPILCYRCAAASAEPAS